MTNRWAVLALLFGARTVMSFQFQVVGAIGPGLEAVYGVGLAEIGFAIGLYFLPGIVVAIPGARLGARFGEGRIVTGALALMTVGAALMALADGWGAFLIGQGIAGVGGVMLNILMSKMVADWFAGREIATAMSIFINSWPLGIALSLVLMPPILGGYGIAAGFWGLAAASALFAVLVAVLYRAPTSDGPRPAARALTPTERLAALASGGVWGFFNAGIAIVFGFGTALLVSQGAELAAAARATSLVLWVTTLLSPFGGLLADRIAHPARLIAGGLVGLALFVPAVALTGGHWAVFVAIGCCTGTIAGAIMALPAIALPPVARATGMGLFFTVYYVSFVLAPPLGGALAEATGSTAAAFWLGGLFEVAALASLWLYVRTTRSALAAKPA